MNRRRQSRFISSPKTPLDKGAACLQCRKLKARCDGLRPQCSRCHHIGRNCAYSAGAPRRSLGAALEARTVKLELITHKLTISSAHSLLLVSKKLQERISRLGTVLNHEHMPQEMEYPHNHVPPAPHEDGELQQGSENRDGPRTGLRAPLTDIVRELESIRLEDLQELPSSLSDMLIRLFHPFRPHYYLLLDTPHFLHCLSLPASHPESIHPCLLNACYLGACASIGGDLAPFKSVFLQRTRHFLQQSLAFADRPIHFLWASIVLGVFLGSERRLAECLVLAGGTSRFAVACGLILPSNSARDENNLHQTEYLLPPPTDKVDADDRVRLAYSIFCLGQCLSRMGPYAPAYTYDIGDDGWSRVLEKISSLHPDTQMALTEEEVWHIELHIKAMILKTFGRVQDFVDYVAEHGYRGAEEEYRAIEKDIHVKPTAALQRFDKRGAQVLEALDSPYPQLLLAHPTLYGSGILLHGLRAHEDVEARRKMFKCIQALIDICDNARGSRRLHVAMVNAIHIGNAVRILARELQRSNPEKNPRLSTELCHSIELFLDYFDDMTLMFPAWADAAVPLKDTLLAAAAALPS
ncbi:hypothetical protein DL93DRAFT_2231222 [Clavulina sp. PMI_390]|nr:hypothetical protein DL93DRAFT_2231222 [Clavulina sp. PMI_390]